MKSKKRRRNSKSRMGAASPGKASRKVSGSSKKASKSGMVSKLGGVLSLLFGTQVVSQKIGVDSAESSDVGGIPGFNRADLHFS